MDSPQSTSQFYAQQMARFDYGTALWQPAPMHNYSNVNIGDVGYIRSGLFHLLFAAATPLGTRRLGKDVPKTFQQLQLGWIITDSPRDPEVLCTGAQLVGGADSGASAALNPFTQPRARLAFELKENRGAIFVTQNPIIREDVELEGRLEDYIKTHYNSWVTFAHSTGHGRVDPILVTGTDMTSDFAMLAYSNIGRHLNVEFQAEIPAFVSSSVSELHAEGLVYRNFGPQLRSPSKLTSDMGLPGNSISSETPPCLSNQCVFLRYYAVRNRASLISRIMRPEADLPDLGSQGGLDDSCPRVEVDCGGDADWECDMEVGVKSWDSANEAVVAQHTSSESDPLDSLAEYIFRNSSADIALVHHYDISPLLKSGDGRGFQALLSQNAPEVFTDLDGIARINCNSERQSLADNCWRSRQNQTIVPSGRGDNSASPTDALSMNPTETATSLEALDPKSTKYIEVVHSLLPHVSAMEGQVAQTFIDSLDKILDSQGDTNISSSFLPALQNLCGRTGLLPSSYILSDGVYRTRDLPTAKGGSANVWEGEYKGALVAIKDLRTTLGDDRETIKKKFCKEAVLWKRLSHPNIVPFLGVNATHPPSMVSQWMMHGHMLEYIHSHPETNRPQLLVEICQGLRFLHSYGVVHGDLKGSNTLIDYEGRARLADFGVTSITSYLNAMNPQTIDSRPGGAYRWMAPELLVPESVNLSDNKPSAKSDIYALAMVTIELFTGCVPFHNLKEPAMIFRVMQGHRPQRPEEARSIGLSDSIWKVVESCWQTEREKRPSIDIVLDDLGQAHPVSPPVEAHADNLSAGDVGQGVCALSTASTLGSRAVCCAAASHFDIHRGSVDESYLTVPPVLGFTIPQRRFQPRNSRTRLTGSAQSQSIVFSMENEGGFTVRDALNRNYTGLLQSNEATLCVPGSTFISIRIEWPGYLPWSRRIGKSGRISISHGELGTEIGKLLKLFIQEMQTKPVSGSDQQWQVGPVGSKYINVNSVVLVALQRVSLASWQPVFRLLA